MNNISAFAKVNSDGTVTVSGDILYGGNPDDVSQLKNVRKIYSNKYAFAALKNDGTVYCWGDPMAGGDNTQVIDLRDVKEIYSTISAFAALKNDGTIYCWGNQSNGGNSNDTLKLKDVIQIIPNTFSFKAELKDGTTFEWGMLEYDNYTPDIRVVEINDSNEILEEKLNDILTKKCITNLSSLVDATSPEYFNQRKGIYILREIFYIMHRTPTNRERFASLLNWLHKTNYMVPIKPNQNGNYYSMQGNFEVFNFTYCAFLSLLIYRFNFEKTTKEGMEFLKLSFNNARQYLNKLLSRTHQNGRIDEYLYPGTKFKSYAANNAYLLSDIPKLVDSILENNKKEVYSIRNRIVTLMLENFHNGFILSENIKKKSIILYNNYYMSFLLSILIIFKESNIIFPFEHFKVRLGPVINRLKRLISEDETVRHSVLLEYAKFYSQFDDDIDTTGYYSSYNSDTKSPQTGKYFINDISYKSEKTINKFRVVISLYEYVYGENKINVPNVEIEEGFVNIKDLVRALKLWSFKSEEDITNDVQVQKILNFAQNKLKEVKASKGDIDKINFLHI